MRIYDFGNDYKRFVIERVRSLPRHGHGEFQKIARALRISSSLLSQIFRGSKDLTAEQAEALAQHLGLGELESEYFVLAVLRERAGTNGLRQRFEKRMGEIRGRADELVNRIPHSVELTEGAKAMFYSDWSYSAVRLLSAVPGHQDAGAIAEALDLPQAVVRSVLDFLLAHGLCVDDGKGGVRMGPQRTHVPSSSPLVSRHHVNWRLKAINALPQPDVTDLFFTSPMTFSVKDKETLRRLLVDCIQAVNSVVDPSPSEMLGCLNIDFFAVTSP